MATPKKDPHAVALGRRGGAAATEAQKRAARANGRKGGRPTRVSPPRVTAPAQPRVRHQARVRARPSASDTFGA